MFSLPVSGVDEHIVLEVMRRMLVTDREPRLVLVMAHDRFQVGTKKEI